MLVLSFGLQPWDRTWMIGKWNLYPISSIYWIVATLVRMVKTTGSGFRIVGETLPWNLSFTISLVSALPQTCLDSLWSANVLRFAGLLLRIASLPLITRGNDTPWWWLQMAATCVFAMVNPCPICLCQVASTVWFTIISWFIVSKACSGSLVDHLCSWQILPFLVERPNPSGPNLYFFGHHPGRQMEICCLGLNLVKFQISLLHFIFRDWALVIRTPLLVPSYTSSGIPHFWVPSSWTLTVVPWVPRAQLGLVAY